LARAVPVLLVAGVSLALGRGDQMAGLGMLGMGLVALGCLILPMPSFRSFQLKQYLTPCCLLALLAAVGTTGYTVIDDLALHQLRSPAGWGLSSVMTAYLYLPLQTGMTSLVLAVYCLLSPGERGRLGELRKGNWRSAALTGIIMMSNYGLVLTAMAFAADVSYISAFRQLSIPIGATLGVVVQGEPRHAPKVAGILVVLLGQILVAVG
jgi:drug/metabolite transporter (DMT)-like permease